MKKIFLIGVALFALGMMIACNGDNNRIIGSIDSVNQEIQESGDRINEMFADTIEEYHEGLISFEENGKFGFKDSLGHIVIKAQFDQVGCFNEGLASVTVGAKRERYLSSNGDSATMWIGGKQGFIDRAGKIVVKPQYDYCNFFSQGVAVVAKDDKWGYIDRTGKEIIKLQYDKAEAFYDSNGFAAVSKDGKWGLIDIKGRVVVPIKHESAFSTQRGVATVYPFDKSIISYQVYNDGTIIEEKVQ